MALVSPIMRVCLCCHSLARDMQSSAHKGWLLSAANDSSSLLCYIWQAGPFGHCWHACPGMFSLNVLVVLLRLNISNAVL